MQDDYMRRISPRKKTLPYGIWSVQTPNGEVLASGGNEFTHKPLSDEQKANAQLMGAAPELAQALIALLSEVDEMTSRVGWAGNGAREAARDALAKAGAT
jgi:hypothetical protein